MKNKTRLYLGIAFAALIGLPVAWWLLSPLWVNVQVDESFPTAAAQVVEPTAMEEPAAMTEEAGMTMLAQGAFYNIVHAGSGQAIVYQLADGSRVLRLQDFSVDNGPDLYVYLVPVNPVPDTIGSEIPGSVNLGALKGNLGDQNYDIPADLDLSQFQSVVIWCRAFRVPFSAAPLVVQ
jgi:hypothetical protein